MKFLHLIVPLFVLLVSCAKDSAAQKATAAPTHKSLNERLNEKNGYAQDANGNWKAQNDKRSEFEGKGESYYAKKDFKQANYKTADYAKQSWWGNQDYARKSYTGNTDGSRFQKPSSSQSQSAQESSTAAHVPADPYQTSGYSTGAAREAGTAPVRKTSNTAIEDRRKVFQQPDIIDWQQQRGLSMDQSKGLLGH